MDTRRVLLQHLAPDRGEVGFLRRASADPRRLEAGPVAPRLRKRRQVHLAVGCERQRLERDEQRGDHLRRQARREKGAQLLRSRGGFRSGHEIADQHLVVRRIAARDNHRLPHRRVRRQRRLDLARLHTKAADLDLAVDPPGEFDAAVGAVARQISGAVKPRPRRIAPRVGYEALGGDVRTVQVAARQPVATRVQLAHHADLQRTQLGIEHERLGVRDRPADRHGGVQGIIRTDPVAAGEGGVLGRAVAINEAAGRQLSHHLPRHRHREHIAAGKQLAHRPQRRQVPVSQLAKQACGQPQSRDPFALDEGRQLREGRRGGGVDDETGPIEQAPPDLEGRRIERDRRELEDDLPLVQLGKIDPLHQAQDVPVGDADTLGPSRRPRGVHHVGQVAGHGAARDILVGPARQSRLVAIDEDDPPRRLPRQPRLETLLREQHGRARIGEHERQSRLGVGGIQR